MKLPDRFYQMVSINIFKIANRKILRSKIKDSAVPTIVYGQNQDMFSPRKYAVIKFVATSNLNVVSRVGYVIHLWFDVVITFFI